MARGRLGDGLRPWTAGPGRMSHAQHLERCVRLPREEWTPGDAAAWALEEFRADAAGHLIKQVKRGNVKAMALYFRLVDTPETKPGAAVQVNVGQQRNEFRFVLEEVTAADVRGLRQLSPARALPSGPVAEGETIDLTESMTS